MKIGFLGCGNMGSAVALTLCKSTDYEVFVYSHGRTAADFAKTHEKAVLCASVGELVSVSDIVVIAVKPQVLPSLYDRLKGCNSGSRKWISLAAGVSLETLTGRLGTPDVVRFMPNVAAKAGKSVTAIACAPGCDRGFAQTAYGIAKLFGSAFELEERLFGAFIGTSASAIAYMFQFIHALGLGGCREGLAYSKAVEMACDTMLGAVELVKSSGRNAVELEASVCSAGGTTVEGVRVLEEAGFNGIVMDAVSAAAQRAVELERKFQA